MFTGEYILSILLSIPGLLLAISMHEAAHGYAAYLMGDYTAKYQGRLSLNPLHHIDPLGAVCMLLFRFGWAKPVPINPYNFRNQRRGIIIVSLAGPAANFVLGFISAMLVGVVVCFADPNSVEYVYGSFIASGYGFSLTSSSVLDFAAQIMQMSMFMNVGLMIFNLIPIPPLDGSKILLEFLPYRAKAVIYRYERYFSLILLLLVYVGTLTPVLGTLQMYVLRFYSLVCKGIFGLFI